MRITFEKTIMSTSFNSTIEVVTLRVAFIRRKKKINVGKIFLSFFDTNRKKFPILKINGRETKQLRHDTRNMSEVMW